jgi:hypothetical protein
VARTGGRRGCPGLLYLLLKPGLVYAKCLVNIINVRAGCGIRPGGRTSGRPDAVGGRLASDRRVRDKSEVVTTGPSSFLALVGARTLCAVSSVK